MICESERPFSYDLGLWHTRGGKADLAPYSASGDGLEGHPLSYVGTPFDYDVFVSYAHAEAETKAPLTRDWSRYVAGRLRDLLATALNVDSGSPGSDAQVFFDDRVLVSGQPLTQTLRAKAERSAGARGLRRGQGSLNRSPSRIGDLHAKDVNRPFDSSTSFAPGREAVSEPRYRLDLTRGRNAVARSQRRHRRNPHQGWPGARVLDRGRHVRTTSSLASWTALSGAAWRSSMGETGQ
jgi:hypothetical protein